MLDKNQQPATQTLEGTITATELPVAAAELPVAAAELPVAATELPVAAAELERLLDTLQGELQMVSNERDNLRDRIVPQLRARIEGLEAEAADQAKLTYEISKIQQELQIFKSQNAELDSLRVQTAELPITTADLPVAAAELPITAADLPVAAAELPITMADLPVAAAELPITAADLPVAAAKLRAPGEFCFGYWDEPRDRGHYIVLVLPWENLSGVFPQGFPKRKLEQFFLPIPEYYNSKGLSIRGWASGYQDSDESIGERQVPVMWYDQNISFGWLHIRNISDLPSDLRNSPWEERDDWEITRESITRSPLSVEQCLGYIEKLLQPEPCRAQQTGPKASLGATSVVTTSTKRWREGRDFRESQESGPTFSEKAQVELQIQKLNEELSIAQENIRSLEECLLYHW
ncbi:hypothetical protein B0I37DRAFT_446302 [Chaetomium sp. MPI-CAGE-AT-0009]|nr:hypothetical protein B0I37DRAFT_446302 [Chaetomium sp. MPI-CAGE-AT-0009]